MPLANKVPAIGQRQVVLKNLVGPFGQLGAGFPSKSGLFGNSSRLAFSSLIGRSVFTPGTRALNRRYPSNGPGCREAGGRGYRDGRPDRMLINAG